MTVQKRKRPKVSPRLIRKASSTKPDQSFEAAGTREQTRTGYKISGTTCKEYETFFEYIAESQATDKLRHMKKSRTYRVMGGRGFATVTEEDGTKRSVVLVPGVEFTAEPGTFYELVTTSQFPLEVYITQAPSYEARVERIEADTVANIDPETLEDVDVVQNHLQETTPYRRASNKAALQQVKLRSSRGQFVSTKSSDISAAAVQEDKSFRVNVSPSFGRDLPGEPG